MDILCQAKSGMGKTAVFVLATLQQLEPVDGQVIYFMAFFRYAVFCSNNQSLPRILIQVKNMD